MTANVPQLLLSLLVGLAVGIGAGAVLLARLRCHGGPLGEGMDSLLLGLLVLAGFALGAFLTYVFL